MGVRIFELGTLSFVLCFDFQNSIANWAELDDDA